MHVAIQFCAQIDSCNIKLGFASQLYSDWRFVIDKVGGTCIEKSPQFLVGRNSTTPQPILRAASPLLNLPLAPTIPPATRANWSYKGLLPGG